MTSPRRFLLRMALFLALVAVAVAVLSAGFERAFRHNVGLNTLIVGILVIGIFLDFRRVAMLGREIRWVEGFRSGQPPTSHTAPRLLAPLASMLRDRHDRLNLSPQALRTLLDGLASRLDESREIGRYFTGLMILLGLLGTFWGLALTVGSIGDVIRNLTISGDDPQAAFAALKNGLDTPLSGMGTAFSSSLIGLAGSLVLGFLELQSGQAENTFYNDLEEWLSTQTRLSSGAALVVEGGDQAVPAYIQALLEQTADSLDGLQRAMARSEDNRASAATNLNALTDRLGVLAEQMKTEQSLMLRLAENQMEMKPLLARLAEGALTSGLDEQARGYLRHIDQSLSRMVEEATAGRDQMVRDIRGEFRLLARTIAAIAEEEAAGRQSGGEG